MLNKSIALSLVACLLITACSDDKGAESNKNTVQKVTKINKAFAKRDTNNDGQISRKEFVNFAVTRAESKPLKIDTNSDASVSMEEFTASKEKLQEKLKAQGMSEQEITDRIAKQYAGFDVNKDGSVTTSEFVQRLATHTFISKDSNKDNKLTPEEFMAKPAQKAQASSLKASAPALQETVTK